MQWLWLHIQMTVELMVNECYGGFGFSREALDAYAVRKREAHQGQPSGQDCSSYYSFQIERHDPIMVQIVKEMGDRAWGVCASITIQTIPAQYIRHYVIEEFEGAEQIVIQYAKYKLDSAKSLLHNPNLTRAEKLARLSALLHASLD